MSSIPAKNDLPKDFCLLQETGFSDPHDQNRPNRLCICFSDVHFTDGTVGNQGADAVVWGEVFGRIKDLCVAHEIVELTMVLVGDVADVIRSASWSQNNVYPWQRDHPRFQEILRSILEGIIRLHAQPPSSEGKCGFFHLLQHLRADIEQYTFNVRTSRVRNVGTLVLLGNHDKEILADDETLAQFYDKCLGRPVATLSDDYRRWLGMMYFGDEHHYLDAARKSVPWLPFYWGDPGFRLFVTHGQWRDKDNSRRIEAQGGKPGWRVEDGWRLDVWRDLRFAPFTAACFGDTVAAGVLSGFIHRAKNRLLELPTATSSQQREITRLIRILDELDLYRPTSAAVKRIIEETWRLREVDDQLVQAREIVEDELMDLIHAWLGWDFTMESASPVIRWILRIAKPIVTLLKLLGARIELGFLYVLMSLLAKLQQWHREAPSYREMQRFPAFLEDHRRYGFRIHGEGHTHTSLQEELYFKTPETPEHRRNYTYINFGTWRDQLVPKHKQGYRRRGLGRALVVLDKLPGKDGTERLFASWVEDILTWRDHSDRLDIHADRRIAGVRNPRLD